MRSIKIVKIIDSQKLVINAGLSDGISRGQKLIVFDPGEEVIDPETGESLGTLDTIKCYLNVSDVFDKMAICVNAATMSDNLNFAGILLNGMNEPKPLPVDAEDISGGLQPRTRIKIGDLVRPAE